MDGVGGLEDAGGLDCSSGLIGTGGSETLAGLGGFGKARRINTWVRSSWCAMGWLG